MLSLAFGLHYASYVLVPCVAAGSQGHTQNRCFILDTCVCQRSTSSLAEKKNPPFRLFSGVELSPDAKQHLADNKATEETAQAKFPGTLLELLEPFSSHLFNRCSCFAYFFRSGSFFSPLYSPANNLIVRSSTTLQPHDERYRRCAHCKGQTL